MKVITLIVPQAFATGPQLDENGKLIPGSWPAGLPYEDMKGWTQVGMNPILGRVLAEFVADNDWPIGDIPVGWQSNASYLWNGVSQNHVDEEGDFQSGMAMEQKTIQPAYTNHIPPPVDENGDPTGDPAVYHRLHKYAGWPSIDEIEANL